MAASRATSSGPEEGARGVKSPETLTEAMGMTFFCFFRFFYFAFAFGLGFLLCVRLEQRKREVRCRAAREEGEERNRGGESARKKSRKHSGPSLAAGGGFFLFSAVIAAEVPPSQVLCCAPALPCFLPWLSPPIDEQRRMRSIAVENKGRTAL